MATNNTEEIEEVEKKEQEVMNFDEFPPELLIKHPLRHTWTLWHHEHSKNKTYEDNLKEVTSFDTVEDFWSLYNYIKPPSELRHGCDYDIFKQGIRPTFEDDANKGGGRWLIQLKKKQRNVDLDHLWLKTLLCMIGEAFNGYSDDVCGAAVNLRVKGDKISLWTKFNSQNTVMEIGRKLKERLKVTSKLTIVYNLHTDRHSKVAYLEVL